MRFRWIKISSEYLKILFLFTYNLFCFWAGINRCCLFVCVCVGVFYNIYFLKTYSLILIRSSWVVTQTVSQKYSNLDTLTFWNFFYYFVLSQRLVESLLQNCKIHVCDGRIENSQIRNVAKYTFYITTFLFTWNWKMKQQQKVLLNRKRD